ncbi:hypothetical protein [Streptomyces sp. NPDC059979]|uniref:hypothetical protein n=1 Tax=unclassified Streptomyces TaxID=2593676 RepID=UPI003652A219
MSVHGVQPVMWAGSVDNWLNVTPTKGSVAVSRTGNAYPDMEVVMYQKYQKPRWIAHDSVAHTSGYGAPTVSTASSTRTVTTGRGLMAPARRAAEMRKLS